MKNTIKATAVLILAGTTVKGEVKVYEPGLSVNHLRVRSSRSQLETKYFTNGVYDSHKSDMRKKEILGTINDIRRELRHMAMSYKHLEDGRVVEPNKRMAKEAIRVIEESNKLIDRIFTN